MADLILANASAKSTLAPTDKLLGYDTNSDEFSALLEVLEDYNWSRFNPTIATTKYVSGIMDGAGITTTPTLSANLATFVPFRIRRAVTLSKLCARVVAAGSNIDMALYASNNTTGRPTGSALVSTGSVVANSANTSVEGTVSLSIGYNQTNKPGIYWFGLNNDNATLTVRGYTQAANVLATLFGASTLSIAAGDASNRAGSGVTTPLTFGTWGDLTSATWTELSGVNAGKAPIPFYKVA